MAPQSSIWMFAAIVFLPLLVLAAAGALLHKFRKLSVSHRAIEALNGQLKKQIDSHTSAEKHLEEIINSLTDPIFVKDRKHCWVLLNDACCQFIGHPRKALIGKSDYEFFPKNEADVFWEKDELVFRTGEQNENEEEFTDSKGVTHTITTKKSLYRDHNGNAFIVGIIRDITEKKYNERALRQRTEDLAHSQAERDNLELFAYVASHDLREPLQAIMGFGDLLSNTSAESLSDSGKGFLKKIQDAAVRMSQLIDDLLKFAKVVKQSDTHAPIELKKLVDDVLEDFELRIQKTGARVEVTGLPVIKGDESQIRQLFQNLISNSLKFISPDEKPVIRITARPAGEGQVEIQVQDNGVGFDDKFASRAFKPFERLHGRKEYDGNGIGLAICQKIVMHHSGMIYVKSKIHGGTTFSIVLPIPEK